MANAIVTRTYQDHSISYNSDGWFNATQAAAKFGKRVDHWLETKETQEYIAALCEDSNTRKDGYLKAKRGNNGGTWLHPKLAVMFARWLDVRFAIWCDGQIDDIVRSGKQWAAARHDTRISNVVENAIIKATRADLGKETTAVHYMSEAKLIAFAAFGEFAGRDRGSMSTQELALVSNLEVHNGVMYARGLDYEARKARLVEMAEAWRARHAKLLA